MGRSSKNMKRPNRAEKVARQINTPTVVATSSSSFRPSPPPSTVIPLFNTSRKSARPAPITPIQEQDPALDAPRSKKSSLQDKLKAAKSSIRSDSLSAQDKLAGGKTGARKSGGKSGGGILGGVDYLKLHEKRPGGVKRFR